MRPHYEKQTNFKITEEIPMHYYQLHQFMKSAFEKPGRKKEVPELGISISHFDFLSEDAKYFLPGSGHLYCKKHRIGFEEDVIRSKPSLSALETSDYNILCNKSFQYHIIQDSSIAQVDGVVIMFHGLNEKKWDKYLPWAYEIAKKTQKAVVLFPIAFHMDRAPEAWSFRNEMYEVAQMRRMNYADNSDCSYVNAAISSRMEANPQRIFWSGLQTYSDIIRLVRSIREGKIASIAPGASVDLFGYSIGSFLSMILMMGNPEGIFSDSKLFCFCGGMTIDRMYPISKYIMDARAAIAMQKSFAELLSTNFASDARLAHYQDSREHPNESWFKTMLRYNHYQEDREQRIKELQYQIKSLVLKKDRVTPPIEALNTLKGGYREIDVEVQIEDFSHPYSHMVPFPLTVKNSAEVDKSFAIFVDAVSEFFTRKTGR